MNFNKDILLFIRGEWLLLLLLSIPNILFSNSAPLYFSTLILPLLLLNRNKILKFFDFTSLLLLLFSFFYFSIQILNGFDVEFRTFIIFIILPFSYYILGYYIVDKYKNVNVHLFFLFYILLSFGFQHFYITIIDIYSVGLINPYRQLSIVGNIQQGITLRIVALSAFLSLSGILICKCKTNYENKIKKMGLLMSFLALICTLHYLSRTGIALFLLSFIFTYMYLYRNNIKHLLLMLLLFSIFLVIFDSIFNISSIIFNSELFSLYKDREIDGSSLYDAGGRVERWLGGISMLFSYPFGYNLLEKGYTYAHNLWLDVSRVSGIIPFGLLIIIGIQNIIIAYKILFSHTFHFPKLYSVSLLLLLLNFYIQSSMEPILEGQPMFFMYYILFCGMCKGIYANANHYSKKSL